MPLLDVLEQDDEGALVRDGSYNFWPAWSPDGQRLAFVGLEAESETYAILLLDIANGEVTSLLGLAEASFNVPLAWSPDGRRLAFALIPPQARQALLYMLELDGDKVGEPRLLAVGTSAAWRP